jgi:hypothetical protein
MYYAPTLTIYTFSMEGKMEQAYSGTTTIQFKGAGFGPSFNLGYKLINGQSFQFYMQGGAGLMLFPTVTKSENFKSYASIPIYESRSEKMKQPYNLSLDIQAGFLVSKRIAIWASYYAPMTMISETTYSATQKLVQIGIKYLHKRKY